MPPAISPELEALTATRDNLRSSIAARDANAGQSDGFRRVTDQERGRLREVEARIAEITPEAAPFGAAAPAPKAAK